MDGKIINRPVIGVHKSEIMEGREVSTQTNVNRVQQDPFLNQDLEEAGLVNSEPQTAEAFNRDKTGRIDIPVPFPFPPPTQADLIAQELKEAGLEDEGRETLGKALPVIEELVKNPEFVQKVAETGHSIDYDEVQKFREEFKQPRQHAPRDPDLRAFKEQVIKAFKHLGLDTRQFFGI